MDKSNAPVRKVRGMPKNLLSLDEYFTKVDKKIANMERLEKEGASTFRQLEARCSDPNTGKLDDDIVISAIHKLQNEREIRSFYLGYAKDIRAHPDRYPTIAAKDPADYARYDIRLALGLHFTSSKTHKLWQRAIPNLYSTRFKTGMDLNPVCR